MAMRFPGLTLSAAITLMLCGAALVSSSLISSSSTFADDLATRDTFWRNNAFLCAGSSILFPSKEVKGHPQDCDDGDMTLFNGLLCSAGEAAGCDAVALSQSADGRWWRSPRRIGMEATRYDVSFSPDQSLGVLLYVLRTGDKVRFSHWLSWIESHRPCLTKIGGKCFQYGWLRFCSDDVDKRCTLRPADCVRLEAVAQTIGVDGSLCRRTMRELGLPTDILRPLGDFLLGAAAVNDPGYPQHLVGVDILLARKLGVDPSKVNQAAAILTARTNDNPFFQYLNVGATAGVRAAVLSTCPAPERPSGNRFQWTWERVARPDAWVDSMYWECIFLGDLLR
ncbi:hypothetical protein [Mesorhizobium sp. J8]|uniref:hypothetical protein n=1 Tax=Mesorhizobium sp. J8 TaxID=2777475 RepID=UPI001916AA62|nr:hypothetical protein [Mesorhizobium sp. J8]